jgi:hypothetical protein
LLQILYDTWALVLDPSTGNVLALDCFDGHADVASPEWIIPNQHDLASLKVSEDGLGFLVAIYKSGIGKWGRR